MADTVNIGLIGAGAIARGMYVPAAQGLRGDGVRLTAVADSVPGKAAELAAKTGAVAYDDYRALLDHPDLHAVIVATTIGTHFPIALAALQAGKHVLQQKPMATRVEDADRLIEEAEARHLTLQCEPPHVMNQSAQRAREDISAGRIGKVCLVVSRAAHAGPPDRPWFYFREHGGSVIFDMGVHALTWVLGVGGPARSVTAVYTRSLEERLINDAPLKPDIIDNALITLELHSGALASVITNYCTVATLTPSVEVYGSEGTILVGAPQGGYMRFSAGGTLQRQGAGDLGWFVPTTTGGHIARPLPAAPGLAGANPRQSSLAHFADCVRNGATPVPNGRVGRHALEIMVKAAEAAATGRLQELSTTF